MGNDLTLDIDKIDLMKIKMHNHIIHSSMIMTSSGKNKKYHDKSLYIFN